MTNEETAEGMVTVARADLFRALMKMRAGLTAGDLQGLMPEMLGVDIHSTGTISIPRIKLEETMTFLFESTLSLDENPESARLHFEGRLKSMSDDELILQIKKSAMISASRVNQEKAMGELWIPNFKNPVTDDELVETLTNTAKRMPSKTLTEAEKAEPAQAQQQSVDTEKLRSSLQEDIKYLESIDISTQEGADSFAKAASAFSAKLHSMVGAGLPEAEAARIREQISNISRSGHAVVQHHAAAERARDKQDEFHAAKVMMQAPYTREIALLNHQSDK